MTINQGEITNNERANRFEEALIRYSDECGHATSLIDLLADARHWCDRINQSFGELDRVAHGHYLTELTEERRTS